MAKIAAMQRMPNWRPQLMFIAMILRVKFSSFSPSRAVRGWVDDWVCQGRDGEWGGKNERRGRKEDKEREACRSLSPPPAGPATPVPLRGTGVQTRRVQIRLWHAAGWCELRRDDHDGGDDGGRIHRELRGIIHRDTRGCARGGKVRTAL
jgi:hypothetical protein